jgi:hypothetical protein
VIVYNTSKSDTYVAESLCFQHKELHPISHFSTIGIVLKDRFNLLCFYFIELGSKISSFFSSRGSSTSEDETNNTANATNEDIPVVVRIFLFKDRIFMNIFFRIIQKQILPNKQQNLLRKTVNRLICIH